MGLIEGSEKKHNVKIENIVCKVDSVKATKPIQKLASLEYLRALKEHLSFQEKEPKLLSDTTEYAIDKAVRQRMQQGLFGYDHSQLIAVEMELNKLSLNENSKDREVTEELKNKMLLERLEAAEKQSVNAKMTYDDWKRKKDAEDRLKKRLINEALSIEKEQEKREIDEKISQEAETSKIYRDWARAKRKEEKLKKREKKMQEKANEEDKNKKREEASVHYKEWLRGNLIKLKEQKKKERKEKKAKEAKEKEIERKKEEDKIRAELAYQEWLMNKLNKTDSSTSEMYSEPKIKKPIMLAYSPNKKKIPAIQHSYEGYSQSISEEDEEYSQYTDEEEEESAPIISSQKPPRHGNLQPGRNVHRVDDNHTFEDLSSIRRSPHVVDTYQNEPEESESEYEESSYEEDEMNRS